MHVYMLQQEMYMREQSCAVNFPLHSATELVQIRSPSMSNCFLRAWCHTMAIFSSTVIHEYAYAHEFCILACVTEINVVNYVFHASFAKREC